jgi:hypothetical protein
MGLEYLLIGKFADSTVVSAALVFVQIDQLRLQASN